MSLIDLVVSPLLLLFFSVFIFIYTSNLEYKSDRLFFSWGLSLKLLAGICLGLIYEYYYGGGDTFNYFKEGKIISSALKDDFSSGIKLVFSSGEYNIDTYAYAVQLYWYNSPKEFFVSKIAGVISYLFFDSYIAVSLFFSFYSFLGLWNLYTTLVYMDSKLRLSAGFSIFLIPSVIFWSSGLLKESLVIGSLGYLFSGAYFFFIKGKQRITFIFYIIFSSYIIYSIKSYILFAFIPPFIYFIVAAYGNFIGNKAIRVLIKPVFIILGIFFSYKSIIIFGETNEDFQITSIAEKTKVGADYLYYVSQMQDGSGYYLGDLDGSVESMIRLMPKAINVSLFRPYLWEVKNLFMLISSLESLSFLILFVRTIFLYRLSFIKSIFSNPFFTFCILFVLILAIAVGLNSFNFGTLVRYRTPFLPFFVILLIGFPATHIGKEEEKIIQKSQLISD